MHNTFGIDLFVKLLSKTISDDLERTATWSKSKFTGMSKLIPEKERRVGQSYWRVVRKRSKGKSSDRRKAEVEKEPKEEGDKLTEKDSNSATDSSHDKESSQKDSSKKDGVANASQDLKRAIQDEGKEKEALVNKKSKNEP